MRASLAALLAALLLAGCSPAAEAPTATVPAVGPPSWPPAEFRLPVAYSYTVTLREAGTVFEGWVELCFAPAGEPTRLSWYLGGEEGRDEAPLATAGLPGAVLTLGDEAVQSLLGATLLSPLLDRPVKLVVGETDSWPDGETRITRTVERWLTVAALEGCLVRWQVRAAGVELDLEAVLAPEHPLPLLAVLREAGGCGLEVRLRSTW